MKFIFTCPETHRMFTSANFVITDHRGITTDASGKRHLEAKVALIDPCSHCGKRHVFHAGELACPFGDGEKK